MITKIMVLTGKKPEHERVIVFENDKKSIRVMSDTDDYKALAKYASFFNVPVEEHYEPLTVTYHHPLGYYSFPVEV